MRQLVCWIIAIGVASCEFSIGPQGESVTIDGLRRYASDDGDWIYFDVRSHKDIEGRLEIRAEFKTDSGTIHKTHGANGKKGALSPDMYMIPGRQWNKLKLKAYERRALERDIELGCEGCGTFERETIPLEE